MLKFRVQINGMNQLYRVFFVIGIMILVGYIHNRPQSATEEVVKQKKLAEMVANADYNYLRTADPVSGNIPSGALMRAFYSLKDKGFYQPHNSVLKTTEETGWQQVNDFFPSLAVTRITYDPSNTQIFYFCTGEGWFNADAVKGAGVFKSIDGGATWAQLASTANSNFDYCQDIVVHPTNGDVYVATRESGLMRSQDGGESWEKVLGVSLGATRNSVCDIELTSSGEIFAAIGIFETDGIYYSASGDAGTFVKQTTGLPASGFFRIEMATAPSDENVAYSIFCNSSDYRVKGIYKTTDKGATWEEINRPEDNYEFAARQAWYDLSLAVDPNNANVVAMGGLHLWRSRNAGDTWERMTTGGLDSVLIRFMHVDQHEITFRNSDEVYFGNDGGIYRTTNFTADQPFIYDRNYGYNVTQFYSVAVHPTEGISQLMGGTQDNGTPYTYDSGNAPFKMVSGGDGAFTAYDHEKPEVFYTASQLKRLFRFNNGGFELPDTITNPNLEDYNTLFINPFDIDASDPEVIYQCSNIGLMRLKNASTADTGQWLKCVNLNGVLSAIASSPAAPGSLFIGKSSASGDIYRLDDCYNSDATVVPFNLDPFDSLPDAGFLSTVYCSSIVVDVHDANHVIVTYSNYNVKSVWESFNAMAFEPTWHCIEGNLPDIPVYWSAIHPDFPNIVYLATELGVFYTNNVNGYSTVWIPCIDFPIVRTDMLRIKYSENILVAATHGRGLWQAKLLINVPINNLRWEERGPNNFGGRTRTIMIDPNDPSGKTVWAGSVGGGLWKTTNIDAVPIVQPDIVESISLQVYPNPAADYINLHVTFAQPSNSTISLLDMQGNSIADIPSIKGTAEQTIRWNIPANLGAGNYFIMVRSGQQKMVKKIIIL